MENSIGWNKKEGKLIDNSKCDLLSEISYSLFAGKHTTTYKYCFLKSILENIYCVDENYIISFERIGTTFCAVYWNMICVHKIPQMSTYCTGERSVFEKIIERIVLNKSNLDGVRFESISKKDQNEYLAEALREFQKNVIGAFYNDLNGHLFGFSKQEKKIWFNKKSFDFLTDHRILLEQVNYYEWLKMIDSILKINNKQIKNLSTILEEITKRTNLDSFKEKLGKRGEEFVCFYCGKKLTAKAPLDHVIPWDYLKTDDMWNLVFACKQCNSSKSNKLPHIKYIYKLKRRNSIRKIDSPDIKKIYDSAIKNGLKTNWKPKE